MYEAAAEYGQRYLIKLFAYIIVFNEVNDPISLWNKFKKDMMSLHCHIYELNEEEGEYQALKDLREVFKTHQKTNKDFRLP